MPREDLVSLLGLARCDIATEAASASSALTGATLGEEVEVELRSRSERIGSVTVWPPSARTKLSAAERNVLENVSAQLSLALQSTRLAAEVREAQLDAETNQLRAALFSGVTHDLKTPIAAMTASVTSLLEGDSFSDQERFEHLDTIRQEIAHLNRLVTNLMDLARMRAGALVPNRVQASIDELIEAVVGRLRPSLNGRTIELSLSEDLPEMSLDVVQIDQVLSNLIENSIKFSPPDHPIRIAAVGDTDLVRVTVSDEGPGIPAADRERVFQPFERGDGKEVGTGLGLAIARAAVVAHGGRMWIREGFGGGTAITFELPNVGGEGS